LAHILSVLAEVATTAIRWALSFSYLTWHCGFHC